MCFQCAATSLKTIGVVIDASWDSPPPRVIKITLTQTIVLKYTTCFDICMYYEMINAIRLVNNHC